MPKEDVNKENEKQSGLTESKSSTQEIFKTTLPMHLQFYNWTEKLSNESYDYFVISIGSGGETTQQLPAFTNALAGKIFVLNIDPNFLCNDSEILALKNKVLATPSITLEYSDIPYKDKNKLKEILKTKLDNGAKIIIVNHMSPFFPNDILSLANENLDKINQRDLTLISSYHAAQPCIVVNKNYIQTQINRRNGIADDNTEKFVSMLTDLYMSGGPLNVEEDIANNLYGDFGKIRRIFSEIQVGDITGKTLAVEAEKGHVDIAPISDEKKQAPSKQR